MNEFSLPEHIASRARQVRLLALDVDGVLSDGRLYYGHNGGEWKAFHILDGHGIKLLQRCGIKVALITGRESPMVWRRARELDIGLVVQGREDKLAALEEILAPLGIVPGECAYIGDDLPDLPCIRRVGLGLTVPNAHPLVREHALAVTSLPGGGGAVREACDWILQAQGRYDDAVAPYL